MGPPNKLHSHSSSHQGRADGNLNLGKIQTGPGGAPEEFGCVRPSFRQQHQTRAGLSSLIPLVQWWGWCDSERDLIAEFRCNSAPDLHPGKGESFSLCSSPARRVQPPDGDQALLPRPGEGMRGNWFQLHQGRLTLGIRTFFLHCRSGQALEWPGRGCNQHLWKCSGGTRGQVRGDGAAGFVVGLDDLKVSSSLVVLGQLGSAFLGSALLVLALLGSAGLCSAPLSVLAILAPGDGHCHCSTAQLHTSGDENGKSCSVLSSHLREFHWMFPSRWPELLIELGKFPFPLTFFSHLTPNQSSGWLKKPHGPRGMQMAPWCESCCLWLVALMSFQCSVHQENIP